MGISRPREILEEVTKLRMFETTTQIVKFLREEFGLAATVEATKPGEFVDVYLTNYTHAEDIELELPDDKIAKEIMKLFNEIHKDETLKALNVWPTEYGYVIVLDDVTENGEELNENYLYYYYYGNVNLNNNNDTNVNYDMRKPLKEAKEDEEEALRRITKADDDKPAKEEPKQDVEQPRDDEEDFEEDFEDEIDQPKETGKPETKTKQKQDLEQDLSNTVLDNRFIWYFMVLDQYADELTGEIDNLDEAIDKLVYNNSAALLVAYPYIDPNPEDDNVELVFADNPGPVIIYDREDE